MPSLRSDCPAVLLPLSPGTDTIDRQRVPTGNTAPARYRTLAAALKTDMQPEYFGVPPSLKRLHLAATSLPCFKAIGSSTG